MALSQELVLIVEQMSALGEKAAKLESRGVTLEGQNKLLTEELEKARGRNVQMVKDFNRKLKELEAKGGVKGDMEVKEEVKGDKKENNGAVVGGQELGPMQVFSKDMWESYFPKMELNELKACYMSHPDFRSLLQEYRTIILFPDVVKVLAANVQGFGIQSRYHLPSRFFRKMNPLLQCRLVCQHWKNGVDQFLQQESPSFTPVPEANFVVPAFQFKYKAIDYSYGKLTALQPDVNPMPSRFLLYSDNFYDRTTDRQKKEFEQAFSTFLNKFGVHVWSLKVKLRQRTEQGIASGYSSLLKNLPTMPNLKELYLCNPLTNWWITTATPGDDEIWDDDQINAMSDARQLEYLVQEVSKGQFPSLPDLERVTFEDCPPILIHSVLKANPQVKQLKIIQHPENQTTYDLGDLDLPNLREAHLDYYQEYLGDPSYWLLTKLTLDAPAIRDWNYLKDFGMGSAFENTLQELDLRLYGPCISPEDGRLVLPALKILKLKLTRCFCSIDFILPLVNLEMLEVDFCNMCKGDMRNSGFKPVGEILQVIKIHGYVDKLGLSNVWQLLPKLKHLRARTDWNEKVKGMFPEMYPKWYSCYRSDLY